MELLKSWRVFSLHLAEMRRKFTAPVVVWIDAIPAFPPVNLCLRSQPQETKFKRTHSIAIVVLF